MDTAFCWILVILLLGPVVGWVSLGVVIPRAINGRIAQMGCPNCEYDRGPTATAGVCPECGMNREDAARHRWRPRMWLVTWPLAPAALYGLVFGVLGVTFTSGERAFAIACLAAPFAWLAVVGGASKLQRWPLLAWVSIGVPAAIALCLLFFGYTSLVLDASTSSYLAITHGVGPVMMSLVAVGVIGWYQAIVAWVVSKRGPMAPVDSDGYPVLAIAGERSCKACGSDLAGNAKGICFVCGEVIQANE